MKTIEIIRRFKDEHMFDVGDRLIMDDDERAARFARRWAGKIRVVQRGRPPLSDRRMADPDVES